MTFDEYMSAMMQDPEMQAQYMMLRDIFGNGDPLTQDAFPQNYDPSAFQPPYDAATFPPDMAQQPFFHSPPDEFVNFF